MVFDILGPIHDKAPDPVPKAPVTEAPEIEPVPACTYAESMLTDAQYQRYDEVMCAVYDLLTVLYQDESLVSQLCEDDPETLEAFAESVVREAVDYFGITVHFPRVVEDPETGAETVETLI